MGAYNPPVTPEQFSTSQMWIQNGPEEQLNSIEAAWALISPYRYDYEAFRYIPNSLAITLPEFSAIGQLMVIKVQVASTSSALVSFKEKIFDSRGSISGTSKWWLSVGGQVIGYWPKELFTHLAQNASIVRYGGIAGAVSGSPSPPMGNGHFPEYQDYDLAKAGFMREMKVFNEAGEIVYFDYTRALRKLDTKKETCYKLYYYSYSS
ncbi:uncharacterized protein LOC113272216 [Papaver somniferum]|uniref:uncharacterized protein LOC113272216 n=1 Tax=Papaver somniferum TaxID=3469 RepID=UPI000E6FEC23|nr:uncharacterized protein LOC113272216 [Papaver somniferum]